MHEMIIKYGPTEPRKPPFPRLNISRHNKELAKILDDYLDLLAELEKIASENTDPVYKNNLFSILKANLNSLKRDWISARHHQLGDSVGDSE